MSRITKSASALERLAECPSSAALPQVSRTTQWSEMGKAVHKYLEEARDPKVGRTKALEHVAEDYYELCAAIELDKLPEGTFLAEAAYAYNVITGEARFLGAGIDRDYSGLEDYEIPGTSDAIAVSVDAVFVPDWKTGWTAVQPPASNRQLKFLALAAARHYQRDRAIVEVVRIRENGDVWRRRAEFDAFDLAMIAEEVRAIYLAIEERRRMRGAGEDLDFHEGPWCRYCPADIYCAAKTQLVRELAVAASPEGEKALVAATQLNPANPIDAQTLAVAWKKIRAAKSMIHRLEYSLKEAAKRHPVYLGDDTWLGLHEKEGNEKLDGKKAWRIIAELRGREVADEVVEPVVTKKAIDLAVRKTLRKEGKKTEKIKHGVDAILKQLRAEGGAHKPLKTEVCEFQAPAGAVPGVELPPAPPAEAEAEEPAA